MKKFGISVIVILFSSIMFAQSFTVNDVKKLMVKLPEKNIQILRIEVPQKLYSFVMGENPSKFKGENNPVESISWFDAIYFCNKLSRLSGLTPVYSIDGNTDERKWNYTPHKGSYVKGSINIDKNADGYRLPTNSEWDYAARGGENYAYAGSDNYYEVGWKDRTGKRAHTFPVAQKKPNGYGLYDMTCNVAEMSGNTDLFTFLALGGSYSKYQISFKIENCEKFQGSEGSSTVGFRIVCKSIDDAKSENQDFFNKYVKPGTTGDSIFEICKCNFYDSYDTVKKKYPNFERTDVNDLIHYYSSYVSDDEFWQFSFIRDELLQFVKVRLNPSQKYINDMINEFISRYGENFQKKQATLVWEDAGVALIYEDHGSLDLLRTSYFDDVIFRP